MTVILSPAVLTGTVCAPASKSMAHRLLICAALADRPTRITLSSLSGDLEATARCITALGGGVERIAEGVIVTPVTEPPDTPTLLCGESGSTLRFLLPVAAALCPQARLEGAGRLGSRPLVPLLDALRQGGVQSSALGLPVTTWGRLKPGEYALPGNVSSQFVSGLLLALSRVEGVSRVTLTTALESESYVNLTLDTLKTFGADVEAVETGWRVRGQAALHSPGQAAVEGDWSSAAFFLAAGALTGPVRVTGLDVASRQGDRDILKWLRAFGASVEISGSGVTVRPGPLRGRTIDVSQTPDLFPILAVLGACAEGETRLVNAARLRQKESDRIGAMADFLSGLGIQTTQAPDALTIVGGSIRSGAADSAGDHRVAMAAAIAAASAAGPVTLQNAQVVEKSYPAFFTDYQTLGGSIYGA